MLGLANPFERGKRPVNLPDLCKSLGVTDIQEVDPCDYRRTFEVP
jgi:hypothetical protein